MAEGVQQYAVAELTEKKKGPRAFAENEEVDGLMDRIEVWIRGLMLFLYLHQSIR